MGIIENAGLDGNPFEHYTAETEPNISDYAVRPPYLTAIIERSLRLNSFTLFGERGSGKSATRITVFNALWGSADPEANRVLAVNVTDFSQVLSKFQKGELTDRDLVGLVAFNTLEKMLAWLSSLSEEDRNIFIEGLDADERSLAVALLEAFYLPISEMDRDISTSEALKLLNSAWTTKSHVWMSARWGALSKIFATSLGALLTKKIDENLDISQAAESVLKSLKSDGGNAPRAILTKLVQLAQAFGFEGICLLVDKVDETAATTNSAEATARLVYPIFNHIQLLEIDGLSWVFFLWENVKDHFSEKLPVRLDKLAHANITWTDAELREMVEARMQFFSKHRTTFSDLFADDLDVDEVFSRLARLAMKSPRELIRLIDIIIREHDILSYSDRIGHKSLSRGMDSYCVENVGKWYPEKLLYQVLRLGEIAFSNKDVQGKFKIGHQGARNKIIGWEESGVILQDGTIPSEAGNKPVNRYRIDDAKVLRIIENKLLDVVGSEIEDDAENKDQDPKLD